MSHDHPHPDGDAADEHGHDSHVHGPGDPRHGHTHGIVDPSIASTARGLWALKWSFIGLLATALFQAVVVFLSGSVALPHLGHVTVHVDPLGEGGERHHRIGEHAHDGLPAHAHP
jgi:hypothetical protein